MFTAKRIDAETALRLGFVQEVVAEDALEHRVMEVAKMIAENAPLTVAAMKHISIQAMKADPDSRDLKTCDDMVAACFASNDYIEGRNAFMAKRKPNFTGN
jgi:enoyl-CoA hydratase/carnithine racemase